jgi:segregation and condensation protein B
MTEDGGKRAFSLSCNHPLSIIIIMEIPTLIPHIEALIFASDKPLTTQEITDLLNSAFGFMDDRATTEQIGAAMKSIVEKYSADVYPFEVRQSGGGWQFLTKKEYHQTVVLLNGEKFLKRLSAAVLETLAIIAYKQPVTKGEIEIIRGVNCDYSIQKLLEKELVVITGRNEQMPGHPLVYCTSKSFMDYFGINSVEDLPKIKEILADQVIEPTVINHTDFESSNLLVSDEGELVENAETMDENEAKVMPDVSVSDFSEEPKNEITEEESKELQEGNNFSSGGSSSEKRDETPDTSSAKDETSSPDNKAK